MRRVLLGLMLAAAACLTLWYARQRLREPSESADDAAGDNGTFQSPYLNTRPEVAYVGDQTCAECHPTQAETYKHHPMGNALMPVSTLIPTAKVDAAANNPFSKFGYQFSAVVLGTQLFHRIQRRSPQGELIADLNVEVHYALGSGAHGQSFVLNREGRLYQSPVSWFTQKQCWDLSPGYTASMHTERVIQPECLFCHCNHAEPVPDTVNRFREPVFKGYSIGCERCHGPGQLHVELRKRGSQVDGADYTIVNPTNLPPYLREAVCEQCHLAGDARVLRRGKGIFDYRPGLPLHWFWSVFSRRTGMGAQNKAVNHVYQMQESTCYQASKGALGCTSCHDPHAIPTAAERDGYYRPKCLKCHQDTSCKLPSVERRRQTAADDCTQCHMPSFKATNVAHTALANHRIPRIAAPANLEGAASEKPILRLPGQSPIEHFHRRFLDLPEIELDRDQGLTLLEISKRHAEAGMTLLPLARPLLSKAASTWLDDLPVREGWASLLVMEGDFDQARAIYEDILRRHPERETTLVDSAILAEENKRLAEALEYWRRAIAVNPWNAQYHHRAAAILAERGNFAEAVKSCERTLAISPASQDARTLLVSCLLQNGEKSKAEKEFARLLAFDPPNREALERWFRNRSGG